jgi:hypothetical protein
LRITGRLYLCASQKTAINANLCSGLIRSMSDWKRDLDALITETMTFGLGEIGGSHLAMHRCGSNFPNFRFVAICCLQTYACGRFFGRRLADLFGDLLACCNDRLPAVIQVLVKRVALNLAVVLAAEVLVSVRGNNKRHVLGCTFALGRANFHGDEDDGQRGHRRSVHHPADL